MFYNHHTLSRMSWRRQILFLKRFWWRWRWRWWWWRGRRRRRRSTHHHRRRRRLPMMRRNLLAFLRLLALRGDDYHVWIKHWWGRRILFLRRFWRGRWWWWWRRRFWHRPHMHRDRPIGLDHGFPYLWENDFAVWSNEIIVSIMNMWADNINVEESLLDQLFHSLYDRVSCFS